MSVLLWGLVLGVAFAGCRWSGRMLDRHYNDRTEVLAVLMVAACVFGPLLVNEAASLVDGLTVKVSLGAAICAGLLTGRAPSIG